MESQKNGSITLCNETLMDLGENIISIVKEEKDFEVAIQDNLSPETYIEYLVTHAGC